MPKLKMIGNLLLSSQYMYKFYKTLITDELPPNH